jgi:hypothetical protein
MVLLSIKQFIKKEEYLIMTFIKEIILILKQVVNVVDLGYLGGIEKDFPQQLSSTPNRKKRNQELSDDHKKYNKVSDIVSGLINYRIMNHHN